MKSSIFNLANLWYDLVFVCFLGGFIRIKEVTGLVTGLANLKPFAHLSRSERADNFFSVHACIQLNQLLNNR